jgi:hypothetical protein
MRLSVEGESSLGAPGASPLSQSVARSSYELVWALTALEAEPDGSVRLRAVIESLSFETTPPVEAPPSQDFTGKPVTYRLYPDGRVDEVEAPAEWLEDGQPPAWLRTWLEQNSRAEGTPPPQPVELGARWSAEREFQTPGFPLQRLKAESAYLRNEQVGSRPCALVLTRFEVFGRETREEAMPGRSAASVESRIEGGGSRLSCYDLENGRVLESTQTGREHYRLAIRSRGQQSGETGAPLVLESRGLTELYLRAVD